MSTRLGRILAELRLFDRRKYGRVSRRSFWLTLAAHVLVSALAFEIPFETAYQVGLEPDSVFIRVSIYGFLLLQFLTVVSLWRLAGGRLRDAGLSPWWRWLILLPAAGWVALVCLLVRSSIFPNRFDRLPPG